MSEFNSHKPVMLNEVLSFVDNRKMTYIDMTLGRGGHAYKVLEKLSKGSTFYGVDRDIEAINYSKEYLKPFEEIHKLHYLRCKFSKAIEALRIINLSGADFILMDIGVSSPQFDDPSRGFSYRFESRLDMRMDQSQTKTAYDIVNNYSEKELIRVFKDLGQCRIYYPVVKKIIETRVNNPIVTTTQLVDIIKDSLPARELRKVGHPAKQFFLGLRYEVNGEIEELKKGLDDAIKFLNPKGRLVIISFNSEEDKIVKDCIKKYCQEEKSDKYHPILNANKSNYINLTRKPLTPNMKEVEENNRSKPAILRAIERR